MEGNLLCRSLDRFLSQQICSYKPTKYVGQKPDLCRSFRLTSQVTQAIDFHQVSHTFIPAILRAEGCCKVVTVVAPVGEDRGLPHSRGGGTGEGGSSLVPGQKGELRSCSGW